MKLPLLQKSLPVALMLTASAAFSQSTDTAVYNIFQSRCASCHTGSNPPGMLDLSGTSSQVYSNIVNVAPNNSIANGLGDKRIDKGRPHSSFLLRKIQNGLDPDNGLNTGEGNPCPQTGPPLANNDIEKIRQWIYKAAPQTGNVVDTNIINMYYSGQGFDDTVSTHPLPTAPGSYQLHLGKFFLAPGAEQEYFLKYDLRLPDTLEVYKTELFMGQYSHHFIMYKFLPGAAGLFPDSVRIQDPNTGQGSSTGYNNLVAAWQFPQAYNLPTGTAYQWETSTVLDWNHHFFNPDNTNVMAVDVYVNVFTQPKGTAQAIMYSDLIQYNGNLFIPNTAQNIGFQQSDYDPAATNYMNVWLMSTHTHKYGIDYDIYLRNANNTTGQQIYEGFYNTDYTFNQGYYDWAHPAVRRFEPTMLQVDPRLGFIQQATFNNYGPQPVWFGLTTNDEMMLYYIQYTWGGPLASSIGEYHSASEIGLSVFPNPYQDKTNIGYELKQNSVVSVEIFDVVGSKVATLVNNESQASGKHQYSLNAIGGTAGVYFVKVTIDGVGYVQQIVQTQ